jgi:hypothetical protein
MTRRNIAVGLVVLATSLGVSVQSVQAFCQDDSACVPPKHCIEARCQLPSASTLLPRAGIDAVLLGANRCDASAALQAAIYGEPATSDRTSAVRAAVPPKGKG